MSRLHFISCITIALCFLLFTAIGYARNGLVDIMLDLAQVTSSDHVIDLGSGDGRIVIAAAQRGATALGIEYNPVMELVGKLEGDKITFSAGGVARRAGLLCVHAAKSLSSIGKNSISTSPQALQFHRS